MNLKDYFESNNGLGILSTVSNQGEVNAAVYSRPHVMDDGSIALIMNDRLSHKNIMENPRAHYLFKEEGPGYQGIRLSISMLREEKNSDLLYELCRRCHTKDTDLEGTDRFLVFFKVEQELPLIGSKD